MADCQFDVVIAGGGMVGACQALVLAQSCPALTIAVVEAIPVTAAHQASFDGRSIAIAEGSKQLLSQYGIWPGLKHNVAAINDIQVSDRGHIGKSYLTAAEFNLAALGYVAEVRDLGQVIQQKLSALPQVKWFCPDKIIAITAITTDAADNDQRDDNNGSSDGLTLTLQSSQRLTCQLLLVADGGQSSTRQLLNIDNQQTDYGQTAVVANIAIEQGHLGRAYERFTANGPIALLPLTDRRYSLVWCLPPSEIDGVMAWSDQTFIDQLQQAFGYRAGKIVKVGARSSYPLGLSQAQHIVGHRVALIGNASHTIHPIAGQGFNLGLRDIEAMRQLISQAVHGRTDIGSYPLLRQFQQMRQADMQRVITLTDSLVRVFSQPYRPLALLRTLGLLTLQSCELFKRPLAYQAMGFSAIKSQTSDQPGTDQPALNRHQHSTIVGIKPQYLAQ